MVAIIKRQSTELVMVKQRLSSTTNVVEKTSVTKIIITIRYIKNVSRQQLIQGNDGSKHQRVCDKFTGRQSGQCFYCLCDCNWTRTQNHLIRERTLDHMASYTVWIHSERRT